MYINRLKSLITQQGKTIQEAAEAIGLTRSGLTTAMNKDTLKVRDLIGLATWLNIPLQLIFKDEMSSYKTIKDQYLEFNEQKAEYGKLTPSDQILFELKQLSESVSDLSKKVKELEKK